MTTSTPLSAALDREYTNHIRQHIRTLICNHPDYSKVEADARVPSFTPYNSPSSAPKPVWVTLALAFDVLDQGIANAGRATADHGMEEGEDTDASSDSALLDELAAPVATNLQVQASSADTLKVLADAVLEPISTLIAPMLLDQVSSRLEALMEGAQDAISKASAKAFRTPRATMSNDVLHSNMVQGPAALGTVFSFVKDELNSPYAKLAVDVWKGEGCNAAIDSNYLHDPETTGQIAVHLSNGQDVFLHGPRGTGKSELVEQIAARLQRHYAAIQFSADMDKYELIGSKLPVTLADGSKSFVYSPGLLARSISIPGAIIALEEISAAPASFGFVIQNLMSSRRLAVESGEVVPCAEGVVFVATDNTGGFGDATGHYHGTHTVNVALVDRFAHKVESRRLDKEALARIVRRRTGLAFKLAEDACAYQLASEELADTQALSISLSLRRTLAFVKAMQAGIPGEVAFKSAFVLHLPPEEQATFAAHALSHLPLPGNLAKSIQGVI